MFIPQYLGLHMSQGSGMLQQCTDMHVPDRAFWVRSQTLRYTCLGKLKGVGLFIFSMQQRQHRCEHIFVVGIVVEFPVL